MKLRMSVFCKISLLGSLTILSSVPRHGLYGGLMQHLLTLSMLWFWGIILALGKPTLIKLLPQECFRLHRIKQRILRHLMSMLNLTNLELKLSPLNIFLAALPRAHSHPQDLFSFLDLACFLSIYLGWKKNIFSAEFALMGMKASIKWKWDT